MTATMDSKVITLNGVALQFKSEFDSFGEMNKPESGNSGLLRQNLDYGESGHKGKQSTPIMPDTPNLYKQNGAPMENLGYFIIPRSVYLDPRFQSARLKYQKVLITIFANAAFAPTTHAIGSEIIPIGIGQFCVSERQLAELCNEGVSFKEDRVDKNIVHRAVHFWARCQIVNHKVIHDKNILTITVPDFYNREKKKSEPASEPQVNQKRTSKEEDKEDKEDNISIIAADSAIASSEKKKISNPSKKRKKAEPAPLIERDTGIYTSDIAHQKLIQEKGSEEIVREIYSEMTIWKSKKGILGGDDYRTALRWSLSDKPKFLKTRTSENIPKPLNSDLEARRAKGGQAVPRRVYEKIVQKADEEGRPDDKLGYIVNETDGAVTRIP